MDRAKHSARCHTLVGCDARSGISLDGFSDSPGTVRKHINNTPNPAGTTLKAALLVVRDGAQIYTQSMARSRFEMCKTSLSFLVAHLMCYISRANQTSSTETRVQSYDDAASDIEG